MANHEVHYITLSGGQEVPAYLLVCPQCKALDLRLRLDTTVQPWRATCSKGHEYPVDARLNA